MTQLLHAEYLELATFIDALFRYADEATFVSWRAFRDDLKAAPPVFIESTQIPELEPLAAIADAAERYATRAAQFPFPAVFCPPIATFTNATRAREVDLANGLALSVECDAHPARARQLLEQLLGPATVVVASGGIWRDVSGAEAEKLHLHWRLSEPTTASDEHARLKRARILATSLAGGDATNTPAVHPIRWPGSWHRKATPRLARIVTVDANRELVLSDALELLESLGPARPYAPSSNGSASTGETNSTADLVRTLLSGDAIHAPLVALAYRYLKGGMADAQAVLTLRGMMEGIQESSRNRPDAPDRWQGHYNDIPRTVRTAREKLSLEGAAPPAVVDLSEFKAAFIDRPAVIAARRPEFREIPAELLTPPGVLADIARYGVESAVRPVPIFAVQAALTLGSIVCARRYMTTQRNYSSLYFLNVAKSGTGKEEAKTTIERILTAAGARRLIAGSSYSSGNAVFSALLRKPQHLTIIDEFGKYLEAANGQRDTYKGEALTQLMEAFGRVHGDMATPQFSTMTLSSRAAADHEPKIIARPAITLLAMTTPSTFYDAMRSSRVADGFLNRFVVVEHRAPREPMAEWQDVPVPEAAIAWVKQILQPQGNLDVGTQIDHLPAPVLVEVNPTSLAAAKSFEREMVALANRLEENSDGLGAMPLRANEIALRMALICALADTPDTPVVTIDCMEWAIAYVRFFLSQTIAALEERVADTVTRRIRNTILAAIRDAGARGITNWELHRLKQFIDVPKRDRMDAIDSLLQAELIVWTDIPPSAQGRHRRALVAVPEENSALVHDFSANGVQKSESAQTQEPQVVTS